MQEIVSSFTHHFTFDLEDLGEKLLQNSQDQPAGYWQIHLSSSSRVAPSQTWYLALSRQKIVFSGFELLSWTTFFTVLKRYLPRLRSQEVQTQIKAIEEKLTVEQRESLIMMLNQVVAQGLLEHREINEAIKLQVFIDLETYSFNHSENVPGHAGFIPDTHLLALPSCTGLDLSEFISQIQQRQAQWQKLKPYISSLRDIPKLNISAIERQNLSPEKRQQLQKLVDKDRSLWGIARSFGKDPLEIAKYLVSLSHKGLVTMVPAEMSSPQQQSAPRIFIVDDAPIILQQFKAIVNQLGYPVQCWEDPLTAVAKLLEYRPSVIFIDINMPGASGFQLIKQIRLQSELASIPLVILTAEETLSNKMRAKWARSDFLSKPPKKDEIARLLTALAPLSGTSSIELEASNLQLSQALS